MTAFRLFDPFQPFFDNQGRLAVGGRIDFFAAGTTTPKDVFGDQALTVNNGSSVAIGVNGRPVNDSAMPIDIWGDGDYRARLYAADNTEIDDKDDIEIPGGSALIIPALVEGADLSNDGAVLQWVLRQLLPDPTGMGGKWLTNDGVNYFLSSLPTDPTPVTVGSDNLVIGDMMILIGSGTITASGSNVANQTVSFTTAFSGLPLCVLVGRVSGSGDNSAGGMSVLAATGQSASGFTAWADNNLGFIPGEPPITSNINFQYIAIGPAP